MPTSANVTEFRIEKEGRTVDTHRQHAMCKTHWEALLRFVPIEDFTITPYGMDEDYEEWEGATVSLKTFLAGCRPCPLPADTVHVYSPVYSPPALPSDDYNGEEYEAAIAERAPLLAKLLTAMATAFPAPEDMPLEMINELIAVLGKHLPEASFVVRDAPEGLSLPPEEVEAMAGRLGLVDPSPVVQYYYYLQPDLDIVWNGDYETEENEIQLMITNDKEEWDGEGEPDYEDIAAVLRTIPLIVQDHFCMESTILIRREEQNASDQELDDASALALVRNALNAAGWQEDSSDG